MNKLWENPCKRGGSRLDFGHVGGTSMTGDPNSWLPEMWHLLIKAFNIRSMFDVGCGRGFAAKFFSDNGVDAIGLDCKQMQEYFLLDDERFISCDLAEGSCVLPTKRDLVWCCEVAEHIEESKSQFLIDTCADSCCKVLAFCAAPLGARGYHHVNCQEPKWWRERFEAKGLKFQPGVTQLASELCTATNGRSRRNYFLRSGMIFTR